MRVSVLASAQGMLEGFEGSDAERSDGTTVREWSGVSEEAAGDGYHARKDNL